MAEYARGNPARWWRSGWAWAGGHRSPAAMFISPFRRFTSLIVLGVLVLFIIAGWWVTRPTRLSAMAGVLLSEVLGGHVEIDSARLSFSGTIVLRGVTVSTEKSSDPAARIFTADELEVRFDWLSLVTGRLEATQITAVRAGLHLTEDRNRREWNYERLFNRPRPEREGKEGPGTPPVLPVIVLRDASLERGETRDGVFTSTGTTVIDGQLVPVRGAVALYNFHMIEHPGGEGWPKGERRKIEGWWDLVNNVFNADISDILLTRALRQSLPRQAREIWDKYAPEGRLTKLHMTFHPRTGVILHIEPEEVGLVVQLDEHVLPTQEKYFIHFRNVKGSFDIVINDGTIRNIQLEGETQFREPNGVVLTFPFKASGVINTPAESAFNLNLEFPGANVGNDQRGGTGRIYPRVAYVIPQSRDLIERIAPLGRVDVKMSLRRASWNGNVAVQGSVECVDMGMRFAHFPFPLYHVRGPITFDNDTVSFGDERRAVTGVADQSEAAAARRERTRGQNPDEILVDIRGHAGLTWDNQHIDFVVSSQNAVFDERVAACMPEKFQKMWNQFNPRVRGAFNCRVVRGKSGRTMETTVAVNIVDGHAMYEGLPYELKNLRGPIVFGDNETKLGPLHATVGLDNSGEITFTGTVAHPGGDIENLQPNVVLAARNLPIDQAILGALPPEYTAWRSTARVGGKLDIDANLKRGANAAVEFDATVAMKNGSLETLDKEYSLSGIEATTHITPQRVVLDRLTAHAGEKATVEAAGVYERDALALDVKAAWRDYRITETPPKFITGEYATNWGKYKPSGSVDGSLSAKIRMDARTLGNLGKGEAKPATSAATSTSRPDGGPLDFIESYALTLHPTGLRLAPADWPAAVSDISGNITITPEKIALEGVRGMSGKLSLDFSKIDFDRKDESISLAGTVTAPEVPSAWLNVLGADAAGTILSQKPEGDLTLRLRNLSRPGLGKPWSYEGELTSKLLKLSTGPENSVPVECKDVKVTARGTWDNAKAGADALDFAGRIETTTLTLQNRPLEGFKAAMACKEKAVAFTDLDAMVAGGKLQGKITIKFDEPLRYEGTLVLNDADLATLLLSPGAKKEERDKVGSGRITASLAVQEQFGKHPDRTGRGELAVKNGKMYNVPLAMGLMQLVTLRLPVSRSFDRASMTYYIRDNKVTFEKILLESTGINLAGIGSLTLTEKRLDMAFVTDSPREFHILIVTDIVNWLRNELLQISVTGTIDNPEIKAVPLSTLASTLERLLPKKKKP